MPFDNRESLPLTPEEKKRERIRRRAKLRMRQSFGSPDVIIPILFVGFILFLGIISKPRRHSESQPLETAATPTQERTEASNFEITPPSYHAKVPPKIGGSGSISATKLRNLEADGTVYLCTDGAYRSAKTNGSRLEKRGSSYQLVRDY